MIIVTAAPCFLQVQKQWAAEYELKKQYCLWSPACRFGWPLWKPGAGLGRPYLWTCKSLSIYGLMLMWTLLTCEDFASLESLLGCTPTHNYSWSKLCEASSICSVQQLNKKHTKQIWWTKFTCWINSSCRTPKGVWRLIAKVQCVG